MRKFDSSSKKLMWGTTLLAVAILVIPIAKSWLGNRQTTQMWKTKSVFNYRTTVVCEGRNAVRTFDSVNLEQFSLSTGLREWGRSPKSGFPGNPVLTSDGKQLVRIEAGIQGEELVVRDTKTNAVSLRAKLNGINKPTTIHLATPFHAIISESGEKQQAKGMIQVIDLKTGKNLFSQQDHQEIGQDVNAFASFGKEIYLGQFNKDDDFLRVNSLTGQHWDLRVG